MLFFLFCCGQFFSSSSAQFTFDIWCLWIHSLQCFSQITFKLGKLMLLSRMLYFCSQSMVVNSQRMKIIVFQKILWSSLSCIWRLLCFTFVQSFFYSERPCPLPHFIEKFTRTPEHTIHLVGLNTKRCRKKLQHSFSFVLLSDVGWLIILFVFWICGPFFWGRPMASRFFSLGLLWHLQTKAVLWMGKLAYLH